MITFIDYNIGILYDHVLEFFELWGQDLTSLIDAYF